MKNSCVRVLVRWSCVLTLGFAASDTTYAARSFPEPAAPQATTNQLTQYGITWTFDRDYEFGQFANGDYWVVGPLTLVGINPPSTEVDGRTINGSMVNPSPKTGATQGYDSAMYGSYGPYYDPARNVALNVSPSHTLQLPSGSSLVSTISITTAGNRPQLQTAAILTVLPSAPPQGSFRPSDSGADKTIRYNTSQLNYAQLTRLAPVAGTPSLAEVERYFERPWIDHVPNWLGGYHHPESNMPNYGREMAAQVGIGALMLHLDFSNQLHRVVAHASRDCKEATR